MFALPPSSSCNCPEEVPVGKTSYLLADMERSDWTNTCRQFTYRWVLPETKLVFGIYCFPNSFKREHIQPGDSNTSWILNRNTILPFDGALVDILGKSAGNQTTWTPRWTLVDDYPHGCILRHFQCGKRSNKLPFVRLLSHDSCSRPLEPSKHRRFPSHACKVFGSCAP